MEKQWHATSKQLEQLGLTLLVTFVEMMQRMCAQVQYSSLAEMFVSGRLAQRIVVGWGVCMAYLTFAGGV